MKKTRSIVAALAAVAVLAAVASTYSSVPATADPPTRAQVVAATKVHLVAPSAAGRGTPVAMPAGAAMIVQSRVQTANAVYQTKCYTQTARNDVLSATGQIEFTLGTTYGWCAGANVPIGPYIPYIYYFWSVADLNGHATHVTDTWASLGGWAWVGWDDVGNIDPYWISYGGSGHGGIGYWRQGHWHLSFLKWGLQADAYPSNHVQVHADGTWAVQYGLTT